MDLPKYDQLPTVAGMRCSWGLFGDASNDYLGTLNLISEEHAVNAAALIKTGKTFPLNWNMELPNPPLFNRQEFVHEIQGARLSHDDVISNWNTQSSSQWDGFRHIRHPNFANMPGTGHYGGVRDENHGVHHWARKGIVTRGVLADVGRWRLSKGKPLIFDERDSIENEELLECLHDQGTSVMQGDILLVRTGWIEWYESLPTSKRHHVSSDLTFKCPGFQPSERLYSTLWNFGVAAVACDNPTFEVWPPTHLLSDQIYENRHPTQLKQDNQRLFAHDVLIPLLGIPIGELWSLGSLATDCEIDSCYEFFLSSAPLNLLNGVASPPNALAIK